MSGSPVGRQVLVTGASGLVGHAVVSRLRADGARVTAIGHEVRLDLARDPWPAGAWDILVHCAARLPLGPDGPEAEAAIAENRLVDLRAIEAAAAVGAHLIYFSSASVYGPTTGEIDDATPEAPVLEYARAKLDTEAAIASRALPATIFRLVAPYGPRQTRHTVLRKFLDSALTGVPLRYFGSGTRTQDFLHVDDVALAVALAARDRIADRFLLASGANIEMRDLARLVVQAVGSQSPVEAAGVPDPEEGRTVQYRIDRLRTRLGFAPGVALAAGIADWAAVRRQELASGAVR